MFTRSGLNQAGTAAICLLLVIYHTLAGSTTVIEPLYCDFIHALQHSA